MFDTNSMQLTFPLLRGASMKLPSLRNPHTILHKHMVNTNLLQLTFPVENLAMRSFNLVNASYQFGRCNTHGGSVIKQKNYTLERNL